jgi:hypothetical protein
MKHSWLLSLLLATSCHPNGPSAALKEAVAAHLRQHVAGYQPLRWGPLHTWRKVDEDSLVILRYRDREDSLRRSWSRASPMPAKQYADSIISLNERAIRLNKIAAKYDTTRLGTLVDHTYRLRTTNGQIRRDSAQFLALRNGSVIHLPRLKPLY